jgi:hypothetical protein
MHTIISLEQQAAESEERRLRTAEFHFKSAREFLAKAIDQIAAGAAMCNETPRIELHADNTQDAVRLAQRMLCMVRREIEEATGIPRVSQANPARDGEVTL